MSSRGFAIILTLLVAVSCKADPKAILEEGATAYQQSQWDKAQEKFKELEKLNEWKPLALYNLGNIAVRQNHLGQALGYYLRAQHLNPFDSDIRFNIRFVQKKLNLASASGSSLYARFRNQVLDHISLPALLFLTLVFSALAGRGLLPVLRLWKARDLSDNEDEKSPFTLGFAVFSLCFLSFLSLSLMKGFDNLSSRAIVTNEKVDLRSGPSEANVSLGQVSEGLEVSINEKVEGWAQVTYREGLRAPVTGWLPANSIMSVSEGSLL